MSFWSRKINKPNAKLIPARDSRTKKKVKWSTYPVCRPARPVRSLVPAQSPIDFHRINSVDPIRCQYNRTLSARKCGKSLHHPIELWFGSFMSRHAQERFSWLLPPRSCVLLYLYSVSVPFALAAIYFLPCHDYTATISVTISIVVGQNGQRSAPKKKKRSKKEKHYALAAVYFAVWEGGGYDASKALIHK